MAGIVPVTSSLDDVYFEEDIDVQQKRWDHLQASFQERYDHRPQFISRSPGRVNIIGEHIDYSLYEVLPMAITADILIAVYAQEPNSSGNDRNEPTVRLANVQGTTYEAREFNIPPDGDIRIDASSHEWSNYFKAGMRGALDWLRRTRTVGENPVWASLDVLVDGSVPGGSGLSSSSAFVCASALAVLRANGVTSVEKKELVELAIVSERAVGVNSGGMDQSASVFSERGSALYVSFKPELSGQAVQFPTTKPELTFLVAQSFVAADKHVTAPVCYNLRVVECTLAAQVLAKLLGLQRPLPRDSSPLEVSLRGLHDTYFEEKEGISDNSKTPADVFRGQLQKLLQRTQEVLTNVNGYTREEMGDILGQTVDELEERFMTKCPVRADRFLLRQRAIHVFSEAIRVLDFRSQLSSATGEVADLPSRLGRLLNESQRSCRELYECSCAELDEICDLALQAGSYGSRLTGAGWGGCTVHLVPEERVADIKKRLETDYYRKHFPDISEERLAEAVVVSKPANGSFLFEVAGN